MIVETWHEDEPNDGMGHYRLLTGYDDAAQHWTAFDSFDAKDTINPDGAYRASPCPTRTLTTYGRSSTGPP